MKKKLIVLALSGCMVFTGGVYAQTPLFSTAVNESLKSMLNSSGKFTSLQFSDGTFQTTAGGGSYGSGSVFNLGGGTVTGNLAVTGVISGDGSAITGVIADGLSGPNIAGTDSIRLETTTSGKNITFKTALGTGGVYVDNGTTSFKVVPTQYYYYPGLYATTTADATERNFFSIVVSPKVIGANGQMEIYCLHNHGTTSATTPFRIAIYDGVGTQTLFYLSTSVTNYSQTYLLENCGSTSLQYSYGSTAATHGASSNSSTPPGTYTVNTNNTCTVTFSGAGTASVTLYKTIIKTIFLE